MRHIAFAFLALAACTPPRPTGQSAASLTLTAGYEGGLVPVQLRFQAPELVILRNGGVFKLQEDDSILRYAGVISEDRERILGFAYQLWGSGLEGNFSVAEGITDLPSLAIRMWGDSSARQVIVYGYPMGRLREKGGEIVDSLMAAARSARTTRETWLPSELKLWVIPWHGNTMGWRVYEWQGPNLPLDSLAESSAPMELRSDTARAVRDYLAGKTAYTRREMALFKMGDKTYGIAIIPLVR